MKESSQEIRTSGGGVRMFSLMLPVELFDQITNEALRRKLQKKQLIVRAVENYLQTN
jgi:hypothetical protein